jgi:hypothetical protein
MQVARFKMFMLVELILTFGTRLLAALKLAEKNLDFGAKIPNFAVPFYQMILAWN